MFSPYFDEELPREEASKLEEHLSACPSCKTAYSSYKSLFTSVRSLPAVQTSDSFEFRLRARIRAEETAPKKAGWFQGFSRIPLPVPIGAAAVLLIAVFTYTRFSDGNRPAGEIAASKPAAESSSTAPTDVAESTDPATTRTNTRPSFLPDLQRGGVGVTASTEPMGPPYPGDGARRVIHVPRDRNGVPLEGPYLEER